MKFKELFDSVSFEGVLAKLREKYDNICEESYREAFEEIKMLTPKAASSPAKIVIKFFAADPEEEEESEQGFYDVSGYKDGNDTEAWAIELLDWREWLEMDVELQEFSPEEFVAHCLWEMTFVGYSNDEVSSQRQTVIDTYNEVVSQLKSEGKISQDE